MLKEPVAAEVSGLWAFIAGNADAPAMTGLLFPFLFVTIACGACSGFHGLVCGGTTSKQIDKETHCTPIAFGAMLLEGFVAIIALATVLILIPADTTGKSPNAIFGAGIASFITQFVGPEYLKVAQTFGTLAVATFVFDTLDVSVRLGRYLIQELTGQTAARVGRLRAGAVGFAAALATVSVPFLILRTADAGSWQAFWTLFGTSNQLLAALTLLGVTVWLKRAGKKYWFAAIPMLIVMAITLTALSLQILAGARAAINGRWTLDSGAFNPAVLNASVAVLLAGLAAIFIVDGLGSGLRGTRRHDHHHHAG
jgi:carbon starvation protein